MGYQGFFKILMITLISRKNLGGYKIMKHTVVEANFVKSNLGQKRLDMKLVFRPWKGVSSSSSNLNPVTFEDIHSSSSSSKLNPLGSLPSAMQKLQKKMKKMLIVKTKFENTIKHGNRMVKVERLFY